MNPISGKVSVKVYLPFALARKYPNRNFGGQEFRGTVYNAENLASLCGLIGIFRIETKKSAALPDRRFCKPRFSVFASANTDFYVFRRDMKKAHQLVSAGFEPYYGSETSEGF